MTYLEDKAANRGSSLHVLHVRLQAVAEVGIQGLVPQAVVVVEATGMWHGLHVVEFHFGV